MSIMRYWVWLSALHTRPRAKLLLLERFGNDPMKLYFAREEELLSVPGIRKADVDSLTENISNLIDGYNSFIDSASGYSSAYPKSRRLVGEMNHIAELYRTEFEKMGVTYDETGELSLDKDTLRKTALADGGGESLSTIKDFANSVLQKTGQITLNPMQYVEKTIVAYKNPGHNFATPYVTSAYSGMMFNSYC